MGSAASPLLVYVLVALLVPGTRVSAWGAEASEPPRLDLLWIDAARVAEGAFPDMAAESRALLAALGTDVRWSDHPQGAYLDPKAIAVIAVPTAPHGPNRHRHVMGSTRMRTEGVAIWVFPDQVAWTLGLRLDQRSSWGDVWEERFARALARVASHEIVHVLGATAHARRGLMAAEMDRAALTQPVLHIDSTTIETIQRAFDRGQVRARAGSWPPVVGDAGRSR